MTLEELLAMEEIEDLPAWRADVSAEAGKLSEGFQARVAELENQVKELGEKYKETAARNYELMTAVTGKPDEEEEDEEAAEDAADVTELFEEVN